MIIQIIEVTIQPKENHSNEVGSNPLKNLRKQIRDDLNIKKPIMEIINIVIQMVELLFFIFVYIFTISK